MALNHRHDFHSASTPGECREHQQPPLLAFIDSTKAFVLVKQANREGLFRLLEKVGCPTQVAQSDNLLPREHQGGSVIRRFLLTVLPGHQRSQVTQCTHSEPAFLDLLLPPSLICLQVIFGGHLLAYQTSCTTSPVY